MRKMIACDVGYMANTDKSAKQRNQNIRKKPEKLSLPQGVKNGPRENIHLKY